MGKKLFLALFQVLFLSFLFCYAEIPDIKINAEGGVRINLPEILNLTGSFYTQYDEEDFPYAYGASLSLEKICPWFPLEIKGGKLSLSGNLSILNYPSLYASASAFSSGEKQVRKLTASIPSSVSYASKPLGLYSSLSFFKKHGDLSAFITEEEKYGLDAGVTLGFSDKCFLGIQLLGMSSLYSGSKTDSWYNQNPLIPDGRMFSSCMQSIFTWNPFNLWFCCFLYTDPFGNINLMYRAEISGKHFVLSCFYNPGHNVISGGNRTYNELFQIKGNFHEEKKGGNKIPFFWKWGTGFYYQANLCEKQDICKLAFSTGFLNYITSINLLLKGDFESDVSDEKSVSFQLMKASATLTNKWYFASLQPGVKLGFSMEESSSGEYWKYVGTGGVSLTIPAKPYVNLDETYKTSFGNKQMESQLISSLSFKFKTRYISMTTKISMSIEF